MATAVSQAANLPSRLADKDDINVVMLIVNREVTDQRKRRMEGEHSTTGHQSLPMRLFSNAPPKPQASIGYHFGKEIPQDQRWFKSLQISAQARAGNAL